MKRRRRCGTFLDLSCLAALAFLIRDRAGGGGFVARRPFVPRHARDQQLFCGSLHGLRRARPLCRPPVGDGRMRSRLAVRVLPDLNLVSWFAERLSEMPQHVAEYGFLGPVYFVAVAAIAESLTFPVTPMMLTSGYIFGMPFGVAVMLVSMSCAASIHFLLSRTLLRPSIERLVSDSSTVRAVNRAVEREGFRIMFLMRLEPLLPSSVTNFAFGLSSASYSDFIAATFLGYAPYTFALVSSATVLRDILGEGADKPWYLYAIGAVLYVGLLWLITDVASKAIDEAIKEDEVEASVTPTNATSKTDPTTLPRLAAISSE
mmetsp:Transcript_113502/g.321156  ORF Transcript_113502/g.321156 Transcript_113502/m.321156 type:complete len:318 (-) Transcript_113502:206-1159(-)